MDLINVMDGIKVIQLASTTVYHSPVKYNCPIEITFEHDDGKVESLWVDLENLALAKELKRFNAIWPKDGKQHEVTVVLTPKPNNN